MAENVLAWLSFLACLSLSSANELARGWGDGIDWINLEDGKEKAKTEGKPILVLIHKSWCGACKALKPKFAEDPAIAELSSKFLMVNLQDDEEPRDDIYSPDGGYIPRILFFDNKGNIMNEYFNENGSDSYKYYYPRTTDIVQTMRKILDEFPNRSPAEAKKVPDEL